MIEKLEIEAKRENLVKVQDFIDGFLISAGCPNKIKFQIDVAVEEIFVNIANYAYENNDGKATVRVEIDPENIAVDITFIDNGIPYDPLKRVDPDTSLDAESRPIGGLGIFMVKKSMDDVKYEYINGHNILTIRKNIKCE